jgi:hypothetical protein
MLRFTPVKHCITEEHFSHIIIWTLCCVFLRIVSVHPWKWHWRRRKPQEEGKATLTNRVLPPPAQRTAKVQHSQLRNRAGLLEEADSKHLVALVASERSSMRSSECARRSPVDCGCVCGGSRSARSYASAPFATPANALRTTTA